MLRHPPANPDDTCTECGVPFAMASPKCPRKIWNKHPRLTTEQWLNAVTASGTPAKQWRLMYVASEIDVPIEWYGYAKDDPTGWSIDKWFIVPRHLADAYEAACETKAALEVQLAAYLDSNGHDKRFGGERNMPTI